MEYGLQAPRNDPAEVPFLYTPYFSRHETFLQLLHMLQGKLLLPETEAELPQELDLPENKPQQVTQPQEQNIGYTMEGDRSVSTKVNDRWGRWVGKWRENLRDGPYPCPYHVSPRPTAYNLLEMQVCHGFPGTAWGKDRRSGQTLTQGLVFLDYRYGKREGLWFISLYMNSTLHGVL